MRVAVVWKMRGFDEVDGDDMQECMDEFIDNIDTTPLPENGEYVDGSFELASEYAKDMEYLAKYGF